MRDTFQVGHDGNDMLNWASRADATPAARHVRLVSNCIGIQDQHASRNPAILHLPFRVVVGVRCRSTNVAQGCLRHTGNVQLSGQSHTVKQFAQTHRHARGVWTWVFASFAPKLGVHRLFRPCHTREAPWSGHSHSIVSDTHKDLNPRDFLPGYAKLTVRTSDENFRLGAIDGDRCRKGRTATAAVRRVSAVAHS